MAITLPLVLTACGGGGGGSEPLPPPGPPEPPIVRGLTDFQAASLALGQPNLESGGENQGGEAGAQTLASPSGMALAPDGALLVSDFRNNRILVFNAPLSASGQRANAFLGQSSFQGTGASVSLDGLSRPAAVAVGRGKMAVADRDANRVLIYDSIPREGFRPSPTVIIGQANDTSSDPDCSANGLNSPNAVAITPEGKLIIVDRLNNRVLIWDEIPQADVAVPPPTVILGQRDDTHCVANDDDQDGVEDRDEGSGIPVASASTLSNPQAVWSDGTRLVVSDGTNNRVLIWTTFPEDNFQPANIVLGHSTFSNTRTNSEDEEVGGLSHPTARTLAGPSGVHSDGSLLAVADSGNGRVLVWNAFPASHLQAADIVIGKPSFTEEGADSEIPPTSQMMKRPSHVLFTPDSLLVSDDDHHRVLVFRR